MAGIVVPGGDIRSLTLNGRQLLVAPESALKVSLGGKVNSAKLAGDINRTLVVTQDNRAAGFSDCAITNDTANDDLGFVQGLANSAAEVTAVLTLHNGTAYAGKLVVIGEIDLDTKEGSFTIEMRGSTFEVV